MAGRPINPVAMVPVRSPYYQAVSVQPFRPQPQYLPKVNTPLVSTPLVNQSPSQSSSPRAPSTLLVAAPPLALTSQLSALPQEDQVQFWVNNLAQFAVDPVLISLAFAKDESDLTTEQADDLAETYHLKVFDYNALEFYGDSVYETILLDYLTSNRLDVFSDRVAVSKLIQNLRSNSSLQAIASRSRISQNPDVMEAVLGALYFSGVSITQIYNWFWTLSGTKLVLDQRINRYLTGNDEVIDSSEFVPPTLQVRPVRQTRRSRHTGQTGHINQSRETKNVPNDSMSHRAQNINYYYSEPQRTSLLLNLEQFPGLNLNTVLSLLNSDRGNLEFTSQASDSVLGSGEPNNTQLVSIPYDVVGFIGKSYRKIIIADRLKYELGLTASAGELSQRSQQLQNSFNISLMQRLGICRVNPQNDPARCFKAVNRLLGLLYLLYRSDQHEKVSQWLFGLPEAVEIVGY